MSSLGQYDSLQHKYVTKEDIDAAKEKAEEIIVTSKGRLQFDTLSRQRLNDVVKALTKDEVISWGMVGGQTVSLKKEELKKLIEEAEAISGTRAPKLYLKAKEFKDLISSGVRVTARDVCPEVWAEVT